MSAPVRKPLATIDVAIIGGGIMGCATAYYLARKGTSVALFERGRIAHEQSGRAWGLVRQQSRHPDEIPLSAEASRMWPGLAAELGADVEFVRDGILVPAEDERDERRLVEAARISRELGVETRLVGRTEMREILPGAQIVWRTGLYAPRDGHAEPRLAALAYAQAARRAGVAVFENCPVFGIETTNGAVSGVRTGQAVYSCGTVLCAAGVGAAALSLPLGIRLPIQIMRASVAQTLRCETRSNRLAAVWSPRVSFRPRRDGSFYVSNGYRGIDAEHDLTLDSFRQLRLFLPTLVSNWGTVKLHLGSEFVVDLWRKKDPARRFGPWPEPRVNMPLLEKYEKFFYEVYPQLTGLGIARAWAGRIDATPDLLPIIDRFAKPRGYYVAAGFNGHGFALAPALGKALAELIGRGKSPLDLAPFRLARFRDRKVRQRHNAL